MAQKLIFGVPVRPIAIRYGLALIGLPIGLIALGLACSAGDLIGQPSTGPTPTIAPVFSTATPGGQVSISLITPTGDAAFATPTLIPGTAVGNVIAPIATATALYAARQDATGTAGAPTLPPQYANVHCPTPASPVLPPRPTQFSDYPQAIGLFLSAGGAPTTLESLLRSWGALTNGHGVVQADTDLTGDAIQEVIVTLLNPTRVVANNPNNPNGLSPGQLLVYGCAQGGYQLLYSTAYSDQSILPDLKRVGNMNGGPRAQLVYAQQSCPNLADVTSCTQTVAIINWDGSIGAFTPLNNAPIEATGAKVTIADVGGTGILKIVVRLEQTPDVITGPPRNSTTIWDWNGHYYVKALIQLDAPIYRVHEIYDADSAFEQGTFKTALILYDQARDNQYLQPWLDPNELATLRAYANFRKMLAYAALRSPRGVTNMLQALQTENPVGSPAEGWSEAGGAFVDAYNKYSGLHKICTATLTFLNTRPDLLATLNAYGSHNHLYTPPEICPF